MQAAAARVSPELFAETLHAMLITPADEIGRALKGRRNGRDWLVRCPAHGDRKPSLAVAQADTKVLVHCFAGCSQQAVIDALKALRLWPDDQSVERRAQQGR